MKSDLDHALEYHGQAFPGFAKWLRDNPAQSKFIAKVIGHYTREQLREATDAMYGAEKKPYGYSNHAAELQAIIRQDASAAISGPHTGPQVIDGVLVVDCPKCQDTGVASVLSPLTVKRMRAEDPEKGILTCGIVCDCRRGDGRKGSRWDDRHCLIGFARLLVDAESLSRRDKIPLFDAIWQLGLEQVEAFDARQKSRPQDLSGGDLP